jgi:hypothetical protein
MKRIISSIYFVCHLTYEFHMFQPMARRTRLARAVYIVFILQNVERLWKGSEWGIGRWSKMLWKCQEMNIWRGILATFFWILFLNDVWVSSNFLLYPEDIFLLIMKSFTFLFVGATALVSHAAAHCKLGRRFWREDVDFCLDIFEKFGYGGIQYPAYQYVRMNTNYNSPIINLTSYDLRYVAQSLVILPY